ncbi:hypothetical protein [Engelhardtia mirabilis]|uniref:hypothetical protein n=1 Tax=Engelhardtia mirabilis TaxID=2528011 RepID=UPI0011AA976F
MRTLILEGHAEAVASSPTREGSSARGTGAPQVLRRQLLSAVPASVSDLDAGGPLVRGRCA